MKIVAGRSGVRNSALNCFYVYVYAQLIRRARINVSSGVMRGTAVAQWLRCCATNRKVAGSIPAGVIGIFH